ncbi:hypothetical protein NL676_034917 [Syzygium grande]|nr:hypothetical protein NL676_034917 [Syzygium grande]
MEEYNFVVGQEFTDVKAFRNAIKEAAIAQHFKLHIIKSDLIRYFAKCASEGCPWRIRAVKLSSAPNFTIRSLEGTHTCGRNAHDYGIKISYKQAWHAKERGLAAIYGSSEEAYCLLPAYCEQIKRTNPGSVAKVFTTGADNRFHRLFVSFYGSICGFLNGCLPIVGLGGIQLKSKYLGTLLSATSFDADGVLFPLAFGIADVENDESWMWFLSELYSALELNTKTIPKVTFLSYGQKSIVDAVREKFPASTHAFCVHYLSEKIGKEFKNMRLVHLLWKAAYATTTIVFKEKWAEIEDISSDAANWLHLFPPQHWATVIEQIHAKLMIEFEERRLRSSSWFSVLAPSPEKLIVEAIALSSTYQVLRSDEVEFEVLSTERSDIVNIVTVKHMHKKCTQFLEKLSGENQGMPRRLMALKLSDHPSSVDHQDIQKRKDYVWRNSIARNIPSIAIGVTKLDIIRPLAKKEE